MDLKTLGETPSWDWPEDTGATLLAILSDPHAQASDQVVAAELAGDFAVINDELVAALLVIIGRHDATEDLRGTAAISLGPALEHADTTGFDGTEDLVLSEQRFQSIQRSLREIFLDENTPAEVRRKSLEASIRAPEGWHQEAVRAAWRSGQPASRLTAVFCMRFLHGFDDEVLEALESEDPGIHYQAICAAGDSEVAGAWDHVTALATAEETEKTLRLAAIDAMATIRPEAAPGILVELTDSDDEDIGFAASEAMMMAEAISELEALER